MVAVVVCSPLAAGVVGGRLLATCREGGGRSLVGSGRSFTTRREVGGGRLWAAVVRTLIAMK